MSRDEMRRVKIAWQAQYLVMLEGHFSWQVQYLVKFWEIAGAQKFCYFPYKCQNGTSKLPEAAGAR